MNARVPVAAALLACSVQASAGVFIDWWVPVDRHCLVNPDDRETKKAAAGDVEACRSESTVAIEGGEERVDWAKVMGCMETRGWERQPQKIWTDWNSTCANQHTSDAQSYAVITEDLAAEYMVVKKKKANLVSGEVLLAVPPGMLGRHDDDDDDLD